MAERYWSDSDFQWPQGHPYEADTGQFAGMAEGVGAGPAREAHLPSRRRMARAYRRTDERVRDDICERLFHSSAVDTADVSVEVRDGVVIFEGTVPHRGMRYALEDIAAQCMGVVDIENRVRVATQSR